MAGLEALLGSSAVTLEWWQMAARAFLVFLYVWALIRITGRRTLSQISSFDLIVGMILGSMLSRAVTGNSPLVPTLAAAAALVLLHRVLADISVRSVRFEALMKGNAVLLVKDGRLLRDAMRRTTITERDLLESLREGSPHLALSEVKEAYLERNGKISFRA